MILEPSFFRRCAMMARVWLAGLLLAGRLALTSEGCGDDADGDGWAESMDCDDNDPTVHNEASELCDGKDNNCDAGIDNASWYLDVDGDGYGDQPTTCSITLRTTA